MMEIDDTISDVMTELVLAWTCLETIRLEAIPDFGRLLDSSPLSVSDLPVNIQEIESYRNEKRAKELIEASTKGADLEARACAAIENFASFCVMLIGQCDEKGISLSSLEYQLGEEVLQVIQAYSYKMNSISIPASMATVEDSKDPLNVQRNMQSNLARASSQASLTSILYTTSCLDIAKDIYHNLVPIELRQLRCSGPNWIATWSAIRKIYSLESFVQPFASSHPQHSSNGWFFSSSECQLLLKKLLSVKINLINALSRSPPPQKTEIGENGKPLDLSPFCKALTKFLFSSSNPDAPLESELTWFNDNKTDPKSINEANCICFRDIMSVCAGPQLLPIRGDGNCFYRAVSKFFWPDIQGFLESDLANSLRERLNDGVTLTHAISVAEERSRKRKREFEEKSKLANNGDGNMVPEKEQSSSNTKKNGQKRNSPTSSNSTPNASILTPIKIETSTPNYEEFIIPNENDSTKMSAAGVWADHIQVRKMADFTHRPIWILRHDDFHSIVSLSQDGESIEVTPGPIYRINPSSFFQESSPSSSSSSDQNASNQPTTNYRTKSFPPITLFFTPEVHYDVLLKTPITANLRPSITDLDHLALSDESHVTTIAHNFASWLYGLYSEWESLQVLHHRGVAKIASGELYSEVKTELVNASLRLLFKFSTYCTTLEKLKEKHPDFVTLVATSVGGMLASIAVEPIFDDSLLMEPIAQQVWDSIKTQILQGRFSLSKHGAHDNKKSVQATPPLTNLFEMLCSLFDSIQSSTLMESHIKIDTNSSNSSFSSQFPETTHADLTSSQNGAAFLLATLRDVDAPPRPNKIPKHAPS